MLGFVAVAAPGLSRRWKVDVGPRRAWRRRGAGCRGSAVRRGPAMNMDPNNLKPWEDLINEFEVRSRASDVVHSSSDALPGAGESGLSAAPRTFTPRPRGRPLGRENPEQYRSLNLVETSAMTAATLVLWFLGRALQLDSFLILIYPFPSLFIWMRWGPRYGRMMFITTITIILTFMGPLFALTFGLNTGILSLALGTAMWYQWHWVFAILAGCAAKFVGLIINVSWTSAMLRTNTWQLVGEQVKTMIDTAGSVAFRLFRNGAAFQGPSHSQVQLGVALLVAIHSLFHVMLTHMSTTMILDRMYSQGILARTPRLVPWISFLKTVANKQYSDLSADPFARRSGQESGKS